MITTTNLPEPTDQEPLDILKVAKRGKEDPLKLDNIRDVLLSVFSYKPDIVATIERYTSEPTTSQLKVLLLENANWKKQSDIKNHQHGLEICSEELVGIYNVVQILIAHIPKNDYPKDLIVLDKVLGIINIVKNRVIEKKIQTGRSYFVTKASELNRRYLENAVVPSDGKAICVVCGHGNVDFPNSNKVVLAENLKK
jgi:hypothetical protein